MSKFIFFINLILVFSDRVYAYPDDLCKEWFEKTKIVVSSKDCETKCAVAMIDMRTFQCHSQCDKLCFASSFSKYVFYPGLTSKEKALIGAMGVRYSSSGVTTSGVNRKHTRPISMWVAKSDKPSQTSAALCLRRFPRRSVASKNSIARRASWRRRNDGNE